MCFFLSVLFEPGLYKKQGLKKPTLISVQPSQTRHSKIILDPTEHSFIIHPYQSECSPIRSPLHDWASINHTNQHNPHSPGTPAWMLAQHQDAAHRSLMMDLDRLSSGFHNAHPSNLWQPTANYDDYYRNTPFTSCMDTSTGIDNSYHTTNSFDSQSYTSTVDHWNHSNHFTHNPIDYSSSIGSNPSWNDFTHTAMSNPQTDPFSSSSESYF